MSYWFGVRVMILIHFDDKQQKIHHNFRCFYFIFHLFFLLHFKNYTYFDQVPDNFLRVLEYQRIFVNIHLRQEMIGLVKLTKFKNKFNHRNQQPIFKPDVRITCVHNS